MENLLSQIGNISVSGYLICTPLLIISWAVIKNRFDSKQVLSLQNQLFALVSLLILMYLLLMAFTDLQRQDSQLPYWSSHYGIYGRMFMVAIGVKLLAQGFWFVKLRSSQLYSFTIWLVMLGLLISSPISATKGYWALPLPNSFDALFLRFSITGFYLDASLMYLMVVAMWYYGHTWYKGRKQVVKPSG